MLHHFAWETLIDLILVILNIKETDREAVLQFKLDLTTFISLAFAVSISKGENSNIYCALLVCVLRSFLR